VRNGSTTGDLQSVSLSFTRPDGIYDSFVVLISSRSDLNFASRQQEITADWREQNITVKTMH